MAPANRPSQRPLIRIPGPIRRSCWAGIDYDHQPPPCALCVMRRGAIDRHFTGISVSFLRYGGRISGPLPCKEIVLIDGFGGCGGPHAVFKARPMGMNQIYDEFSEDGI